MTATLPDMAASKKGAEQSAEQQAAAEMVRLAKEKGLSALSRLGRPGGESAYLRLSTRPIDQSLAAVPDDARGRAQRRHDVLAGGYLLRTAARMPAVTIAAVGALVPNALCGRSRDSSGLASRNAPWGPCA